MIGADAQCIKSLHTAVNAGRVSIHSVCTAWDAGSAFALFGPELVLQFTELPGLPFTATSSLVDSGRTSDAVLIRCTPDSNCGSMRWIASGPSSESKASNTPMAPIARPRRRRSAERIARK